MKRLLIICLLGFLGMALKAQKAQPEEGSISYIAGENVYVKFQSTENILAGDTLFVNKAGELVPALRVENLSSISCVCSLLGDFEPQVALPVFTSGIRIRVEEKQTLDTISKILPGVLMAKETDTSETAIEEYQREQLISGRFAISSYTNFSNVSKSLSQKMRYTVSFNIKNISGSKLSAESYISFVHDNRRWDEVKNNIFKGLKIYNFSLNYDFTDRTRLVLGRKINPKLSSMGAIDGLQFEQKVGSVSFGIVAGSRPDYRDYSVNVNLFQAGAYVSHDYIKDRKMMQTSLAFIQQMNSGNVDRRFIYLQHTNSLVKNLFFIGTVEADLYKKINNIRSDTFRLSNLYLSLRYRVIRQLSFTVSYNNRQNTVYYETYKNIIDQYMNDNALQGFRFQVNSAPVRNLSVGVTAAYRYRKSDPSQTKNLYAYASYSSIPWLKTSATASFTWLETAYLSGKIYSAGLSKDLSPGKLSGGLNYRHVRYKVISTDSYLDQNIAEINLMWRIMKKLSLSVYYEGTFENINSYNRIYINLTQRL